MAFCEHKRHQEIQQRDLTRRLNDYADGYRDGETDRRSTEHSKS